MHKFKIFISTLLLFSTLSKCANSNRLAWSVYRPLIVKDSGSIMIDPITEKPVHSDVEIQLRCLECGKVELMVNGNRSNFIIFYADPTKTNPDSQNFTNEYYKRVLTEEMNRLLKGGPSGAHIMDFFPKADK